MQHTQSMTTTPAITAAITPVETPEEGDDLEIDGESERDDDSEIDGESERDSKTGGGCKAEPFVAGDGAPRDDGGGLMVS